MSQASDIYQDHLDRITASFWDRDFETLVLEMVYPHKMASSGGLEEVASPTALKSAAIAYRDRLDEMGATAFLRICTAAAFAEGREDRIDGVHRVYILAGGRQVMPVYSSELILLHRQDRWMGAGVRGAYGPSDIGILRPPEGLLDSADF